MADFVAKAKNTISDVKSYWKVPPKGKYMTFKEIGAYAFGGIGAYFIIQLGSTLIVSTTNIIVSTAIGVSPSHSYIIYLIATILNVPLTAVRANMVDNTRGKGGKYRPYLLSMGIPTAIVALIYVWFPYELMYSMFPGKMLGYEKGYWIKLVVVFICNLALHFFFFFFKDAYENLIHVLSPNTQERTDVLAVKAVVYSLAPSIMNFVNPLIAQITKTDQSNILVYRIAYPIYAVIGIGLTIVVFANTEEKIVQAKTHTIQIRFIDALKEVAKNKYFWIISLAGWLGFLELAYYNILYYNQNYGKTVDPAIYGTAWIIIGNASFWGMIAAPFFVKRFGKKSVLVAVNLMNVVCILLMLINVKSFWWLVFCIWLNYLFSAFEQITTPAIQADIRDYQQYKSGERIDGMFAAVATIGNLVTLFTAAVIPAFQEKYGIYEGNGYEKSFDILFVDTGEPGLLWKFLPALIIMCAVGAFLNVVPYFFYDFTEKKQKSVIRVLKVRSLFEDYSNNALENAQIVEAIELVDNARKMAEETPKSTNKLDYQQNGVSKKEAKKAYKEALEYNEEIDISKFVCEELDKFNTALGQHKLEVYTDIFNRGFEFIKDIDLAAVKVERQEAKALPKTTREEKEFRKFRIQIASDKRSAKKAYDKFYGTVNEFKAPDMDALIALFDKEDELDKEIFELAKNKNDKEGAKALSAEKKEVQKEAKALMDEFARFNRAAKPYNDAKKFLKQYENYSHFDEIEALYEDAKAQQEIEEANEEVAETVE
ncbi:MAG: MFS transporter [Eubacterium sp.]|nr:MFS transporter [Eubacterium sp.]